MLAASLLLAPTIIRARDDAAIFAADPLEFANILVKTKEIRELNLDLGRYLVSQFATRLAGACEADPALGEKSLRKATQLFMAAQEHRMIGGANDSSAGFNFASMLVMITGETRPGFGTLRAGWRLFHHDISGQFAHSSLPRRGGWDTALFAAFEKGGGWGDRSAGLRAILEPLHEVIGKDPPGLMLIGFAGFANRLDPWEQIVLGHAADELARNGGDIAPLAKVLSAALWLARSKLLPDSPSDPDAAWLGDTSVWLEQLRGLVNDPAIPELNRFALAAHLVRDLGPLRDATIICTGVEAGINALERDQPTDSSAWEPLLVAFNSLPDNESWRRTAERFHRAWVHRCRFEWDPAGTLRQFSPSLVCRYNALATTARLGKVDAFKSLAALHRLSTTQTFVLMVRYGFHDLASAWLRDSEPQRTHIWIAGLGFRESDHQAVDKFCAGLQAPGHELLARIFMASNPPDDGGAPWLYRPQLPPSWDARLAALAPAFRTTKFETDQMRDLCLFLLSYSPSASLILREEITTSPKRTPPTKYSPIFRVVHESLRIGIADATNGLADGKREPFDKLFGGIRAASARGEDWPYYVALPFLISDLSQVPALLAPESDMNAIKRWRDALDITLESFDGRHQLEGVGRALLGQVALHALAGSSGELGKWRAQLPEKGSGACIQGIKRYWGDPATTITSFCRWKSDALRPREQRMSVINAFLTDPWTRTITDSNFYLLHSLAKMGAATVEELVEAGLGIDSADPGNGGRLRELAALAWHIGRKDLTKRFLDQAAVGAESVELRSRYKLRGAEIK